MAASAALAATARPLPRDVNPAAAALRRLADAAPFAVLVTIWMNQAASGAAIAARQAFGEGSPAAAFAKEAAYAAFLIMFPLIPLGHKRLVMKLKAQRRPLALVGLGRDGRITWVPMMSIAVSCVLILGSLQIKWLAPAKGSGLEMVRAGLSDLGRFLSSVTICSFILPNFIILMRAPAA